MGEIFDSFNAPQFIDFECPDNDEDDVDKYFRIGMLYIFSLK